MCRVKLGVGKDVLKIKPTPDRSFPGLSFFACKVVLVAMIAVCKLKIL
jgi:hypothetical protein